MGTMLRVTVLLDIIPEKIMKILNISVYIVTTLSMLLLFYFSIGVVGGIMASGESSPAMLWPMWIVYSMMVVGFLLGFVRGIQQIIKHVKMFNEHELTTAEQAMAEAKAEAEAAKGGNK